MPAPMVNMVLLRWMSGKPPLSILVWDWLHLFVVSENSTRQMNADRHLSFAQPAKTEKPRKGRRAYIGESIQICPFQMSYAFGRRHPENTSSLMTWNHTQIDTLVSARFLYIVPPKADCTDWLGPIAGDQMQGVTVRIMEELPLEQRLVTPVQQRGIQYVQDILDIPLGKL